MTLTATLTEHLEALRLGALGRSLTPGGPPVARICCFAETRPADGPGDARFQVYAMAVGATVFLAELDHGDCTAAFAQAHARLQSLPEIIRLGVA